MKRTILQLATHEKAFLFRLKFFPLPPEMIAVMENPSITKVGIGIKDDLIGLGKIMNMKPAGFVDLADEMKKKGITSSSLRSLTAIFLGKRLFKKAKTTNWERKDLTPAQIKYAAIDAVVGFLVYEKILELK